MIKRFEELKSILTIVVLMWIGFILSTILPFIKQYGIKPRDWQGLIGIATAPFLHGDITHITMNTTGLLLFGFIYALLKAKDTFSTCIFIILFSGIFTWLMGRSSVHIGASGLVFGLYGYLIAHGWYSRKLIAFFVTFALIFFYGGLIFGVVPGKQGISWEAHLSGFVGGFMLARSRNLRRDQKT
jgi:membrane associated rhomboid family serine protease